MALALAPAPPTERTVAQFLRSHLVTLDFFADGITIARYLCWVVDSFGNRCHCDGYEITHREWGEDGTVVIPLATFTEWR